VTLTFELESYMLVEFDFFVACDCTPSRVSIVQLSLLNLIFKIPIN